MTPNHMRLKTVDGASESVLINGLTEAETNATMSVAGLSNASNMADASHQSMSLHAIANVDALHDHYKRILWDVCKNYGTAGECVFAGFKAALEKELK